MAILQDEHKRLPDEIVHQETYAQAIADPHRHLRLNLDQGQLMLMEDGYVVRGFSVRTSMVLYSEPVEGHDSPLGLQRGVHHITNRVRDGEFTLPSWWVEEKDVPKPDGPIAGLYGARTLLLEDGSMIYSQPEWGPWALDDQVHPRGVEASPYHLGAVFGAVTLGMNVYVY